eukprot:1159049-Pelagomonas_calceolata.AAC.1
MKERVPQHCPTPQQFLQTTPCCSRICHAELHPRCPVAGDLVEVRGFFRWNDRPNLARPAD